MGYNNTYAVEKVTDTLEQDPNVLELKEEKKDFYLIALNKVQEE